MGKEHSSEAQQARARSRWGPPEPRFWAKTQRRESGCLEWTGALFKGGYGAARHPVTQQQTTAHRIAWFYATGEDPPQELQVCHKCDNRLCVNYDHLFLGTAQDNADDKVSKGRQAQGPELAATRPPQKGSQNNYAKLTDDKVRDIRRSFAAGVAPKVLAEQHKVHPTNVLYVVKNKTWKHVV